MRRSNRIVRILLTLAIVLSAMLVFMPTEAQAATSHITDPNDSRITEMLAAIDYQNFSNTGTSATNAKAVIQHFISSSTFKAINGGKFPYRNDGSYTYTVSDNVYSRSITGAKGCAAYSYFVSKVVYNAEGSRRGEQIHTASTLKDLLKTYGQAGDHIRIDNTHSETFISCTDNGFYVLEYLGDSTQKIGLDYWTYSGFINAYSGIKIWLYDANTSQNNTSPPSAAGISISKPHFGIGENVTFSFSANNATGYTIGINKGSVRIDTTSVSAASYTRSFSEAGNYSAYVTAYNASGYVNSATVYFSIASDYVPKVSGLIANGHIYSAYSDHLTWTEAKAVCENMGGHLATITSAEENNVLIRMGNYSGNASVWLGATDAGRSVNNFAWVTGEPFGYTSWYPGQPDNSQNEDYLEMRKYDSGWKWNDLNNNMWGYAADIGFICEVETNFSPVKTIVYGTNKYILFDRPLGFGDASMYCNSLKGHLATITSAGEQQAVYGLVAAGSKGYYLLGGRDAASEGTWTWATSEPFGYTNWAQGEPNNSLGVEDYIMLYRANGLWNDTTYNHGPDFGFVCEVNGYKVTFDSQGGNAIAAKTAFNGDKVAAPTNPIRAGYAFGGWYKEKECTNAWNFAADTVAANKTLYAKWTAVASKVVTFDSQGGSAVAPKSVAYNGKIATPANPNRAGYAFGGWYKERECTNAWNFAADTVTANRTLYAKWTASTTIVVAANNASYGSVAGGGNYAAGTVTTLIATPKAGCRFVRWLEGTKTVSTNAKYQFTVAGPRTLKAEFQKIGTPASFKAASAGYNSLKLTWKAVAGAAGYVICRQNEDGKNYTKVGESTATSFTAKGLTCGKKYTYVVWAYCRAGTVRTEGSYAAITSAAPKPAAPTNLKVVAGAGYITISWKSVAGTTKYEVYRSTKSASGFALVGSSKTAGYRNSKLAKGKTYYFKVRAYRTVNGKKIYGNYSAVISAKVK